MAEFPQDPRDGEHLLPSDIFISEPPSKHGLIISKSNHHNHFSSYMEDLAHQLSTLSLLKQNQHKISHHNIQRFGPVHIPVRSGQENPTCQNCLNGHKNGFNNHISSELYYQLNIRKPVQPNKVGVFIEPGSRVLHRQRFQNRVSHSQNRLGNGGFGVGGFGGTGVFHPRVLNPTNSNIAPTTTTTTTTNAHFVKKRQVMRQNRSEIQVSSQRNTTSIGHYQIASEMALPKDWTY